MAPKHPVTRSRFYSILVSLVISALLLVSCSVPAAVTTPPSPVPGNATSAPVLPTPTLVPPTPTTQVVQDTPTEIPDTPTPIPPSPTPLLQAAPTTAALATSQPAVIPTSAPTGSLNLLAGTTAGVLQGTVQAGQVLAYSMSAGQAQPLTLIMSSPNNDVTLGVFDAYGNTLLSPSSHETRWQMALPGTEMYYVQVIGGATTENFTLTFKLPVVVSFASGASSATLNGTTVNGYLFSYSLNCAAGQTMTASLNVPASTATIDIYGLTSGTLVDISAGYTAWSGTLPQTQDYIVEVVPANNQVVNYSLAVSCTGTPGSPYYYNPGTTSTTTGGKLFFKTGETMTVVSGYIQPGEIVTYSVQASQFQPMMLILGDPNNDLALGVLAPNGVQLLDPANMYTYWQWMLPQTGLYTIQVVGGITSENFTLTTKIGRLYTYPADGTSMTIYATTLKGLVKSYAFRLSAGVVMTLTLNVPNTTAYLDVFGVQTGSILDASTRATTWTGTIPSTQEYVVEVIPGSTMSAYTLTIANP